MVKRETALNIYAVGRRTRASFAVLQHLQFARYALVLALLRSELLVLQLLSDPASSHRMLIMHGAVRRCDYGGSLWVPPIPRYLAALSRRYPEDTLRSSKDTSFPQHHPGPGRFHNIDPTSSRREFYHPGTNSAIRTCRTSRTAASRVHGSRTLRSRETFPVGNSAEKPGAKPAGNFAGDFPREARSGIQTGTPVTVL